MTSMEVYEGFIIGQIGRVPKRAFCPAVRFWVASPFREDQRLNVHTDEKYGRARWSPITPRQRLSLSMCPEIRNPVWFFPPPSASRMNCVLISTSVTLWKNRKIPRKVSLFLGRDDVAPGASPQSICMVWWPESRPPIGPDGKDSDVSRGENAAIGHVGDVGLGL